VLEMNRKTLYILENHGKKTENDFIARRTLDRT
jgi:hypothetical protein